jgi:ribosomal protein S18 acetylase RimI-like enzyme
VTVLDSPRLELSERELALAVEESLFDLFRSFAELPGAELLESDGISMHHAFPTNPMFKGIWAPRLTADELHSAAEEALAWHRARGSSHIFWWAGPSAQPTDLAARVVHHGFRPFELDAPGQVADLAQLDWGSLARVPAGFGAERVEDDRALETFGQTFVEAFEIPDWAGHAWVDATQAFGVGHAPWEMYVGSLDGRAVATNMLFFGAGVATVFAIGTVPDARGRGIGAAITLHGLAEARERGYRYAVLFASEKGAPVYRRIGFRDAADATISRWLWAADGTEVLPTRG